MRHAKDMNSVHMYWRFAPVLLPPASLLASQNEHV